ncbi:lachesin-like [Periplaneta americana]|uniref:lachesin-like n=1 Tax=Periplaneta americana TaxID=6978 RepID=UPI0037E7A7A7
MGSRVILHKVHIVHITPDCGVVSQEEPLITLSPSYKEVERYLSDSHFVTCKSPRGVHMMWTKNMTDKIFATKGRIHIEEAPTGSGIALVFENIDSKDKGNYTCTATVDDKTVHATFKLVVIKPIKFADASTVQSAIENQDVLVRCEVDGDPEPAIMWSIKGKSPDGHKYKVVEDGLFIKNVTVEDIGEYHCRAFQLSRVKSNMLERTIMLKIQHKQSGMEPEGSEKSYGFLNGYVQPGQVTFNRKYSEGSYKHSLFFRCYLTTFNLFSFFQLQITNENVFGDYVCNATNSLGKMEKKISLLKGSKPFVPSVLIDGITPESVRIEIGSPDNEELEILGYRVQYIRKEPPIDDWENANNVNFNAGNVSYILGGLLQNTPYTVRVAARNVAGFSDYTEDIPFTTEKIHADPVTGSTGTATYISSKASQLLVIITLQNIISITGDLKHNL